MEFENPKIVEDKFTYWILVESKKSRRYFLNVLKDQCIWTGDNLMILFPTLEHIVYFYRYTGKTKSWLVWGKPAGLIKGNYPGIPKKQFIDALTEKTGKYHRKPYNDGMRPYSKKRDLYQEMSDYFIGEIKKGTKEELKKQGLFNKLISSLKLK